MRFAKVVQKKAMKTLALSAAFLLPVMAVQTPKAEAAVFLSIGIAPPVLPVYAQPLCPGDGYLWTPGYWAYGDAGYYWVPGVWVLPPQTGFLWTPAYWGWEGGFYRFHGGYWGSHIGFYGGINYGFGYGGVGYEGGYWNNGRFAYNRSVNNINNVHVTNVYNRTVVVNNRTNVSYNGGNGGVNYHANAQEQQAQRENHVQPTANQMSHQQFAAQDRSQLASVNHGRPGVAAAATTASFRQNPNNPQAAARPTVDGREGNQDQRISNGLRSGQMTSGEASRATAQQSRIDQQVHNDRAANGGTLTNQERGQVNREQNNASRNIYNDNHNGNTIQPNAVDNREANQQQRAAQGLRSGQMTSGEAARTNGRQAGVDQQVHNDRTANGGALNQQQRNQVNREQNRNSGQVYNEKHNGNANKPAAAPAHAAPAEHEGGGHPKGR